LRHFKEDVKEVKAGLECGIRLDNFADSVEGDEIEFYNIELKKASL
jgi:translation initiation factor IF-2